MSVGQRQLLVLNSDDRYKGISSDFTISLTNFHRKIAALTPMSCTVPHTIFNITESNNVLVFSQGPLYAVKYVWTLDPGFYTSSDWFLAFKAYADSKGFTIKDDIIYLSGDKFTSHLTNKGEIHTTTYDIRLYPIESTMSKFIGLDPTLESFDSVANVMKLPYQVRMQGVENLYVHMSIATNHSWSSRSGGRQMSLVDIIPLSDFSFGEVARITHEGEDLHTIDFPHGSDPANDIRIWLTDEHENAVLLSEHCNVSIVCLMHTY